jgi:hypothetical protein
MAGQGQLGARAVLYLVLYLLHVHEHVQRS